MNAEIPKSFADLKPLLPLGAKILWASTDMVFDGDHAPYHPQHERNPLTVYGLSKKAGEDFLLGSALVVRFPQLYGLGGTFFQSIYETVSKISNENSQSSQPSAAMKLFGDEWRSTALGTDAARMALDFLEHSTPEDTSQVFLRAS